VQTELSTEGGLAEALGALERVRKTAPELLRMVAERGLVASPGSRPLGGVTGRTD
jgi:hypothetical protein